MASPSGSGTGNGPNITFEVEIMTTVPGEVVSRQVKSYCSAEAVRVTLRNKSFQDGTITPVHISVIEAEKDG